MHRIPPPQQRLPKVRGEPFPLPRIFLLCFPSRTCWLINIAPPPARQAVQWEAALRGRGGQSGARACGRRRLVVALAKAVREGRRTEPDSALHGRRTGAGRCRRRRGCRCSSSSRPAAASGHSSTGFLRAAFSSQAGEENSQAGRERETRRRLRGGSVREDGEEEEEKSGFWGASPSRERHTLRRVCPGGASSERALPGDASPSQSQRLLGGIPPTPPPPRRLPPCSFSGGSLGPAFFLARWGQGGGRARAPTHIGFAAPPRRPPPRPARSLLPSLPLVCARVARVTPFGWI